MLDRIEQVFDMLADAPLTGRARSDLMTGLRSFPVKSYVIFYTVLSDGVEVVRVMHSKQEISAKHMS